MRGMVQRTAIRPFEGAEGAVLMKIMVSACLAGENCKYNGRNEHVRKRQVLGHWNPPKNVALTMKGIRILPAH